MRNLGLYQSMTTAAKKVGGPVQLLLLVGATGYGVLRLGEAGVKKGIKIFKSYQEKKEKDALKDRPTYTVIKPGYSNEGLHFEVGDVITILETDGDAVLIEKKGDPNNPYFVSSEFLKIISDYGKEEKK